jgi:PTS system beta-glucosides-specific IIC component
MKADARRELATNIVDLVGGKDNISNIIHCMTRLRFTIKDKSLVNLDQISDLEGVIGAQWSNEQFQVIIGQWVSELYKDVCEVANIQQQSQLDENLDEKKKFGPGAIIDSISGCLAPVIPIVVGAGMLKVVLILATLLNILKDTSPTYQVLNFASDAGFYFLPVFLGAFSANKFKTSMPLGMLMGAILLHPNFVASVGEGATLSIFGLPIYATTYSSSIFPVIMSVFVMSYVERFFSKIIPNAVKVIFVPLLTILVMLPLALCLIGPAGAFFGVYLAQAIMWLYNTTGFVGIAVLSAVYPLLVITGMHGALFPPMMQSLTTLGYEPIIGLSGVISNLNQGAATLAVAVKNKKERSTAISAAITAILGGVTEPAMFGINLKYKTPLYATMAGSFIGGSIAGLLKVYMYALGGSAGIFGVTGFIAEQSSNIIYLFVAILAGLISTFIITMFIYKVDKK